MSNEVFIGVAVLFIVLLIVGEVAWQQVVFYRKGWGLSASGLTLITIGLVALGVISWSLWTGYGPEYVGLAAITAAAVAIVITGLTWTFDKLIKRFSKESKLDRLTRELEEKYDIKR